MDGHSHQGPPWTGGPPYDISGYIPSMPPPAEFLPHGPPPPLPPPLPQNIPLQHPPLQQAPLRTPTRQRRGYPQKEDRDERDERYKRIAALTRELSSAVRDEMSRRKQLWNVEGSQQEEEYWEDRKQEVYKGLEKLSDEIRRAFRDRRKEAVLDLWSREQQQLQAAAGSQDDRDDLATGHSSSGQY